MEQNLMSKIRNWFAFIMTVVLILFIITIVLLKIGWAELNSEFFLELGLLFGISIYIRLFWAPWAENKADEETGDYSLNKQRDTYDTYIETQIGQPNLSDKLEDALPIFNYINRESYIRHNMGYRSKTKYPKLYIKYLKKAVKIRPIKITEILTRTDVNNLYSSKNNYKSKKIWTSIITLIGSTAFTVLCSLILFDSQTITWEKIGKVILYLTSIFSTLVTTIMMTYNMYKKETVIYLKKLKSIVSKFVEMNKSQGLIEKKLEEIKKEEESYVYD